jgi:hypothetical protein
LSGRELVSSLLLLVALLALATMPSGVGQSLTLTTIGTTQGLSTVFYTDAHTTQFLIQSTGGTYVCNDEAYGPFKLTAGEALSIGVTSNTPISFYIMTASDYQTWAAAPSCAIGSSVQFSRELVTKDRIDMIAPSTGNYDLLLLNFSPTISANVSVDYAHVSQAVTTVFVPVVTEVPVTEPVQQYGLYVIILVLVLASGFLVARRLSGKKTVGTATVAAQQAVPVSGKFCGDCGKPIPIDAEFCPKCGASTEDS